MYKKEATHSFAVRVTVRLVLLVALAFALTSALGLVLVGRTSQRAWEHHADAVARTLAARIAEPMAQGRTALVVATCEGFVISDETAYLRVADGGYATVFVSGEPRAHYVQFSVPIQHGGKTIGRVEVGMASSAWLSALAGAVELNAVTAVAVIAALVASGFFVRRLLRRPLDRLVTLLDHLSLGHYPDPEPTLGYREFSSILGSFGQMASRLRSGETSLRQANARLRAAERSALESASALQTLFDTTPIGLALVVDRTLVRVNARFCEITGYAAGALVGEGFRRVYPSDAEYERIGELLYAPARAAGEAAELQTVWVRKDGAQIDVLIRAAELDAPSGGVRHALTVTDVTEQRRHEADREALRERLARSQRLEAIGTLAGGIAHDFNNILGAIIGYTEFCLKSQTLSPEVREDLEIVRQAGRRAADLVRQILTFSRQASQERAPLQPRVVVAEALKLLRASLPATIEVRARLDCDATVIADPGQLHQIVVNLCTNAALAMKAHGGVLDVELHEAHFEEEAALLEGVEPQRFLRLTVRDTGCGMAQEVRSRIFEPFFTTRGEGEGTGMGLSVVHGIVTASGGFVAVRTAPGIGSTFDVFLPLAEDAAADRPPPDAAGHGAGSERILLVDDEPLLAEVAQRALARGGYAVTAFTSGEEALRAFEASPSSWDAIVTDMTMPGVTGEALIRRARALRPDVPVLLCTGFSEQLTPERAAQLGVDRYAFKPVTPGELRVLLREAIDRRRKAPQLSAAVAGA